jgi:Rieske Fe-S protein
MNGRKVAAFKTESGELLTLSPKCTHLGCTVGWNSGEKTWDCPCHGSRYASDGKVIRGPAQRDLDRVTP